MKEQAKTPVFQEDNGTWAHLTKLVNPLICKMCIRDSDMTDDEVRKIIRKCTDGRFLGIFGEETVNVLEVNLMLDGILEG